MTDQHDSPSLAAPATTPGMQRRWVLGATGLLATLCGVGYAAWRTRQEGPVEPLPGFWGLQWETPQGASLHANAFQGRPLLINFWATWCTPCIEELPLINAFYRDNMVNGWQVLALAIDRPAPVRSFLSKNPVDFAVGMAGLSGADLGKGLGNLSGGLPFSVVIGANGAVLHRKLGRLSVADLEQWSRLK